MAGLSVVAVASAAVAGITALPEVSVLKVSAITSGLCLMIWIARVHVVPTASVSDSVLKVRNLHHTYEIPWQLLTGIDWEPRTGVLSVGLVDGRRVRVEAFSRWPSFGRHRKVIETLEEGRRRAEGSAPEDLHEAESSGITEFLLAIPLAVTLVALVVEGIIALL
ncbi:hypothetical protein [Streptomyces sp. NPDC046909]|uniref:hypothetical protein n=1 Tax=Streptomyces sp. NPDC046909 TaxID=3155617 RepID=UPI0033F8891D